MALIKHRDLDLEQLFDRLEDIEAGAEEGQEAEVPNWPVYRRTLNLILELTRFGGPVILLEKESTDAKNPPAVFC